MGRNSTDASAVEAASQLATIGKAYQGSATLGGLLESLGGVESAVEGIPQYKDATLRKSLRSWLSSTSGKVQKAVKDLPHDADLEDVLSAFEKAGIDVSDPSAQAAAEALAGIGKAYSDGTTLGSIVEGLGGVEKAVGDVAVPEYSDAGLRKDLDQWLRTNSATVGSAIGKLPTGTDISGILAAFEAAGIDVTDASAQSAAGYLSTIGKAYSGPATLGSIVQGLGGVETAVGNIPVYDDTQLYRDAQGWINQNWTKISQTLQGIPSGSSLSTILDKFKEAGFDVNDPAVATGITNLAGSIDKMPAPQVNVKGGDVTYSPPDIDITNVNQNHNTNINNVDTDPIETAMKDAVKGLDVKAQTTVNVQEHDYSDVFGQMGKDIGGGLSDIGDAVGGLDIPDYSGVLDQMGKDLKDVKDDMSTVAESSTARTVPDAEKALRDAQAAAAEEIRRVTDRLSDPATWTNPVELAGALGDTISTVVDSLTDTGSAEEALRQAQNEAAEKGLPDIATAMLAKLGNTDNREEMRAALMEGKTWNYLNQLYRNRAGQAGITQSEWNNAVAAVKAMPTQTQTQAPEVQSSSYYARRGSLASDPYAATVARYDEDGKPWSALPIQAREFYAKLGITGYANGGVFEPNSPVLAVLGDNRREAEVAAPYSTIVKAVRDALSSATLSGAQAIELTANIQLDGRTVARTTLPYHVQESKRLGVSL